MIKKWLHRYMLEYDLHASKLTLALKAACIGLLGFLITPYFAIPQPLFLFLPAIFFMIIGPANALEKYFFSMVFAALLAALGSFLVTIASANNIVLTFVLFLIAFFIIFLSYNKYIYDNSGVIALLIIAVAAGLGGDFHVALLRAFNILIGLSITLTFVYLIFPPFMFSYRVNKACYGLDRLAEFFYHAMSDSLRGNHLQVQHYQTKNQLIEFFIDNYLDGFFFFNWHKKEASKLIAIMQQQQILLNAVIATTNAFNNPLYYSSMAIFSLAIETFTENNYCYYKKAAVAIKTKTTLAFEFEQAQIAIDHLILELRQRLSGVAQSVTPYQGPDLTNAIYLLSILKQHNENLLKVLQA